MLIANYKNCPGPGDQLPPDNSVRESLMDRADEASCGYIDNAIGEIRLHLNDAQNAAWQFNLDKAQQHLQSAVDQLSELVAS